MPYLLEYSKSDKSSCRGPKKDCPSVDRHITKGELRLGTEVENLHGMTWKHWTCVTATVINNMQSVYSDPSEIPGFDELREADQEKIRRAWEEGEVPEDEKPEPASEHIDPRAKNRPTGELPATNEEAAAQGSASSSSKGGRKKKSAVASSKDKEVKEETPEPVKSEDKEVTDEEDTEVKKETDKKKPAATKKGKSKATSSNKPSAAKEKTPKKSRGEPTRRSARLQGEPSSSSSTSAIEPTKKKRAAATSSASGSKKAKKE